MEKYYNIEIYIQELFTHKKFNFILDIANKHIKICKVIYSHSRRNKAKARLIAAPYLTCNYALNGLENQ